QNAIVLRRPAPRSPRYHARPSSTGSGGVFPLLRQSQPFVLWSITTMHGAPLVQRFQPRNTSKLASARLTGLGPLCVPCHPTHVCDSAGDCCRTNGKGTLRSGALLPQPTPTVAE